MLALLALFFFTAASVGFVFFMIKYPHGSEERIWGMRICYALGFSGVAVMRISKGGFSDVSLLIVSSLLISLVTFELSAKYLK
jgi:hypothetical protein